MTKSIRNSVIVLLSASFLSGCANFGNMSREAQIALGVLGALVVYKAVDHH